MNNVMPDYKKIFASEWSLYRAAHPANEIVEKPRIREDAQFDRNVKAGEVRLLADVVPTRTALVYKEQDEDSWLVVPVSEFSVPATDSEALIGRHVYQFWNARPVAREAIERSWLTDRLNKDDLKDVGAVLHSVTRGERLPKGLECCLGEPMKGLNDYRVDYQCEFVLDDDSFSVVAPEEVVIEQHGFDCIDLRKAAKDSNQQANIVYREIDEKTKGGYPSVGCTLDQPFTAIRKDRKQRAISFSWDGELPPEWHLKGEVKVTAHERISRRQIGTGYLDLASKEVVIDQFDGLGNLESPIRNAHDIVIVLSVPKEK